MDKRIPEGARESGDEDFPLGRGGEVLGETGEKDTGVGTDARLGVGLGTGEVAQEIVV